jgi:hypothetical protein
MDSSNVFQVVVWAAIVLAVLAFLRVANIFRYIPNNQVGIVEKLWAAKGSIKSGFIALHGEAGFRPEILRGGIHIFFPFTYRIHKSDLVTVGQGKIAYVFARDGEPLRNHKSSQRTTPSKNPISRTRASFWSMAARRARSERSCAKARTPSTPRSSPSSPMTASTAMRSAARNRASSMR